MGKFVRILLPIGVIVVAILLVGMLASINEGKRPEQRAETEQAMLVETIPAEIQSLVFKVNSQGAVQPRTETTLVSEVSGKVVSVSPNFVAGGFFRKGDVLLEIDPSDYQTALKRAQATLASRQAQLADQEARAEQALRDWENLGRQGQPSDLVLRKPQLAEARANVSAAEADLQKAQRDLQRTKITVPYDGLLKTKQVDIGQYVTPGTSLGVSFAIDTAEIRLPLSDSDLAYLELPSATSGDENNLPSVRLTTSQGDNYAEWEAKIIRTEGVVDESSRVIYAVAEVVDPYGVLGADHVQPLKVGTFVRAEIDGLPADNVVVLPRSVLRPDNTVILADAEKQLEIRPVTVIRSEPDRVYIGGGIYEGEQVITTSLEAPIPGTKLTFQGIEDENPLDDLSAEVAATTENQL